MNVWQAHSPAHCDRARWTDPVDLAVTGKSSSQPTLFNLGRQQGGRWAIARMNRSHTFLDVRELRHARVRSSTDPWRLALGRSTLSSDGRRCSHLATSDRPLHPKRIVGDQSTRRSADATRTDRIRDAGDTSRRWRGQTGRHLLGTDRSLGGPVELAWRRSRASPRSPGLCCTTRPNYLRQEGTQRLQPLPLCSVRGLSAFDRPEVAADRAFVGVFMTSLDYGSRRDQPSARDQQGHSRRSRHRQTCDSARYQRGSLAMRAFSGALLAFIHVWRSR
jgi:hypothetical protein